MFIVKNKILIDSVGNFLCVEFQIHMLARYYSPGIWKKIKPPLDREKAASQAVFFLCNFLPKSDKKKEFSLSCFPYI